MRELFSNVMLQNELESEVARIYHPLSNLSSNKSVGWILNFDCIILHGNHSIDKTYVTLQCCKRLPRAGKADNVYRICCKAVELLAAQHFCNLQQPDLLQDRPNSWVVKCARPLLNSFPSNWCRKSSCTFFVPRFTVPLQIWSV